MSASDKKKVRHEQYVSQMTERQQQEAKEAKKLRLYSAIFTVVIALMIFVVIATTVVRSGIIERNTTAATVNDTKISAAELNHYYIDSVNQFMGQFGNLGALSGIDTTKPLNEQIQDTETNKTWADYFLDNASKSLTQIYAVYNEAIANGYTLSEEGKSQIDANVSNMEMYANLYGYPNINSYIKAIYGQGCNEKTFRKYVETQMIASEYALNHSESLNYDAEKISQKESENPNAYSSFSYQSYFVPASSFYEGGTKDENDQVTYSEEEKAAGLAASKEAAESLLNQEIDSVEAFDKAIAGMSINAEKEVKSTAVKDALYPSVNAIIRDWVADSNRSEGDMTVIANEVESTDADGNPVKETTGYYVLYFVGSSDNNFPLANVRHILLPYEGGTTNESGVTTYTDEEKAAVKTKAEQLLAEFNNGEATEDAFAALANEKSTDPGSNKNGGLYENVYPGQMVPSFNDWCFDAARKAGDTGIVESDYGVHIMYYIGAADITYRNYMITNELRNTDMEQWQSALEEKLSVTLTDTSKVKADLVLDKQ